MEDKPEDFPKVAIVNKDGFKGLDEPVSSERSDPTLVVYGENEEVVQLKKSLRAAEQFAREKARLALVLQYQLTEQDKIFK